MLPTNCHGDIHEVVSEGKAYDTLPDSAIPKKPAPSAMADSLLHMRAPPSPTPSASSASVSSSDELEPSEVMSLTLGKFLPETQEEADIVDEILAKELKEMSLAEQDRALFDVHGIPQVGDDDPENLDAYLDELDRELAEIPEKSAFEEARYVNPNYVNSRKFRTMFLRCERFDAKLAAKKLVKHFEVKKDIFGGGEILGRDIKLSDMSEEDMACLRAGCVQIFPSRDAAGRTVLVISPVLHHRVWQCRLREMWYIFTVACMDEESQKKGMVIVLCAFGPLQRENHDDMKRFHEAREGVPQRIACCHYCYSDETLRPYLSGTSFYYMTKAQRARSRKHLVGKFEDVIFELQTFGIPVTKDLEKPDGSLSLEWHHEWLQSRQALEGASTKNDYESEVIVVPRRFDVLFGRGKNNREHTGNLRCAHLVEMYRPKYEQANKYQKTEIAERIVSVIHESYGRFLKWNKKGGWEVVESDAAREKVSHFFRHLRSKSSLSDEEPDAQAPNSRPKPQPKRVTPIESTLSSYQEAYKKAMTAERGGEVSD